MLKRVDLLNELIKQQEDLLSEEFLVDVHELLLQEGKADAAVRERLRGELNGKAGLAPRLPHSPRVFFGPVIKKLCTRYRLRFLDSKFFRLGLPREAINAVRDLERRTGMTCREFKILAPAGAFNLCDEHADPLLFVPLGPDRYYLVHKWGRDLHWSRRFLYWPFRSPATLVTSLLLIALVITVLTPNWIISQDPQLSTWGAHRLLFFFWSSMVLGSFTVFGWFAFFGKFSKQAWNDHRFN